MVIRPAVLVVMAVIALGAVAGCATTPASPPAASPAPEVPRVAAPPPPASPRPPEALPERFESDDFIVAFAREATRRSPWPPAIWATSGERG
jgi:hypothetical protein